MCSRFIGSDFVMNPTHPHPRVGEKTGESEVPGSTASAHLQVRYRERRGVDFGLSAIELFLTVLIERRPKGRGWDVTGTGSS